MRDRSLSYQNEQHLSVINGHGQLDRFSVPHPYFSVSVHLTNCIGVPSNTTITGQHYSFLHFSLEYYGASRRLCWKALERSSTAWVSYPGPTFELMSDWNSIMEETIQNLATQKLRELLLLCGIGNDNDKVIQNSCLLFKVPILVSILACVVYMCNAWYLLLSIKHEFGLGQKPQSLLINDSIPQTLPTSPHEMCGSYRLLPYAEKQDRNEFTGLTSPTRKKRLMGKKSETTINKHSEMPTSKDLVPLPQNSMGRSPTRRFSTERLWSGLYSTVVSSVSVVPSTWWIQKWSGLGCCGFDSPDWSASTSSRGFGSIIKPDSTTDLDSYWALGILHNSVITSSIWPSTTNHSQLSQSCSLLIGWRASPQPWSSKATRGANCCGAFSAGCRQLVTAFYIFFCSAGQSV